MQRLCCLFSCSILFFAAFFAANSVDEAFKNCRLDSRVMLLRVLS